MDVWVGRVPRGPEGRAREQEEREREIQEGNEQPWIWA